MRISISSRWRGFKSKSSHDGILSWLLLRFFTSGGDFDDEEKNDGVFDDFGSIFATCSSIWGGVGNAATTAAGERICLYHCYS